MSPAIRRARLASGLVGGLGLAAMAPWTGWMVLVLFALVPGPLLLVDRYVARMARPERLIAASLVYYCALILVAVGITGGEHSPLLAWIAIPVVTAAARFRPTVFVTGSLLSAAALLVSVLLGSPHPVLDDPAPLIAIVVLLAALIVSQQPLLDAELRWRKDAILDPLTGLLNRQGLKRRFAELAEQARLTASPLSLVLFDLDQFKAVNDEYGHARGDAVLIDIAYVLRKELRSFELLYRLGGDELLLILPGAQSEDAAKIADDARRAIEDCDPAGLTITASAGVSTAQGTQIDLERMYEEADRALYEAKRRGRVPVRIPLPAV
ncbi:MAG: diguanylate cyclase [Solirubrobacteraceae bacterium]